jgi:hypothetical protein
LTKLTAAAEAEIIGTILAASVEINNRCVAVVAVQKKKQYSGYPKGTDILHMLDK